MTGVLLIKPEQGQCFGVCIPSGIFFSNKFNSRRLIVKLFLKFRAVHNWDRSLFSWDWLRKADASDHSASIDISASAPIDISIKCRDTPSHFSKGLLSRSIPPSINHFSPGKDFDIFCSSCVTRCHLWWVFCFPPLLRAPKQGLATWRGPSPSDLCPFCSLG